MPTCAQRSVSQGRGHGRRTSGRGSGAGDTAGEALGSRDLRAIPTVPATCRERPAGTRAAPREPGHQEGHGTAAGFSCISSETRGRSTSDRQGAFTLQKPPGLLCRQRHLPRVLWGLAQRAPRAGLRPGSPETAQERSDRKISPSPDLHFPLDKVEGLQRASGASAGR